MPSRRANAPRAIDADPRLRAVLVSGVGVGCAHRAIPAGPTLRAVLVSVLGAGCTPRAIPAGPTLRAVLLAAALGAGSLVGSVPLAVAAGGTAVPLHARVVSSTPADGSTVDSVSEVTLEFSEDVSSDFVAVEVRGPGGDEAAGPPTVGGRDVTQPLADDVPPGQHVVAFRVVSVDGHPVSGTVSFETTGSADPSTAPSTGATASPPAPPATGPAGPSPDASGSASDSAAEGPTTSSWWLVALGAAALAGLAAAAVWGRGRRPSDDDDQGPPPGA